MMMPPQMMPTPEMPSPEMPLQGTAPQAPPLPQPPEKKPVKVSKETFNRWKEEIRRGEQRREKHIEAWKQNVAALEGRTPDGGDDDTVWVNKDWSRTKNKVANLFFRVPELQIRARREEFTPAAPLVAAAINHMLSKRMQLPFTVDEILTDAVNAAGLGISVIGYEATTRQAVVPSEPGVSDLPPEIQAGLLVSGELPYESVPVPIHEEWYWDRISPSKFIWPSSFKQTDWDRAPWLGYEFEMPLLAARRRYKLPATFKGSRPKREHELVGDRYSGADTKDDLARGWVIWYRAALYDKDARHPLHLRRMVIIDGHDDGPVVAEDSPYQRIGDDGSVSGVTKFPIRVLSLSYVPDAAVPPSDSQVTRPQVNELIQSRTLMMLQRQRSLPIRWYDINQVDDGAVEIIRAGRMQEWLPMNGPAERAVGEIARATYPRENFEFDKVIANDLDESWAMGANQVGSDTVGDTSATEIRAIQQAIGVRLDYERNKVLRWFVDGAEIVLTLMQLFHTAEDWVEVIGEDGMRRIQPWSSQEIAGEYVFDVKPDATARVDVGKEREDARNLYQFLANDPHVNRVKLLEAVLRTHNLDPASVMVEPPPKGPDPANASFRFNDQALNPMNPAFPIVMQILSQAGYQIDPNVVRAAFQSAQRMLGQVPGAPPGPAGPGEAPPMAEHGGMAEQTEPLSKHHAERGTTI
jgi:hypothetical protein